mmetsp:Transcript_4819/g.17341  ORF Transcript_4819/g.17341 Transcript_4819/m.17341 type:complete len:92 (-) Transcript_4819:161-436(-)
MYSSWPAACTTKLLFLQYASGKAPRLVRACALLADEVGNKHVRSELTVGAAVAAGSARLWAAGEVGLTPGGASTACVIPLNCMVCTQALLC